MKTHCLRGHEFTPENTRLLPRQNGIVHRECRECGRERNRVKRRKNSMQSHGVALENNSHRETGCNLHSDCLTCPLPRCQYDREVDTSASPDAVAERWQTIWRALSSGLSVRNATTRYGVSERQVYRIREARGRVELDNEFMQHYKPPKPVEELGSFYKPRKPLPVMRENLR